MAKPRGARLLTTVFNEEKAELSYQAREDDVILYTRSDFGDEVKRLTEGRDLAAVYDSILKSNVEQSLSASEPAELSYCMDPLAAMFRRSI